MVRALIQGWRLIVLGGLLAGGAALGASFLLPPTYQAEAALVMTHTLISPDFETKIKTISEAEAALLLRTARDLDARRKALVRLVENAQLAREVIQSLGDQLPEDLRTPAKLLRTVEGRNEGDTIVIRVEHSDPEVAAAVANAWAEAYERHVNAIYGETTPTNPEAVTELVTEARSRYEEAQRALEAFLARNRIEELKRLIGEKTALRGTLVDARKTSRTSTVQAEVQERLARLREAYLRQRSVQELLENARALRAQLEDTLEGTGALTSALPLLLLKIQAFAAVTEMPSAGLFNLGQLTETQLDRLKSRTVPVALQLSLPALSDLASSAEAVRRDVDTLIATLEAQDQALEGTIHEQANRLLQLQGYGFLQEQGLSSEGQGASLSDPFELLIVQLEGEINELQAKLEAEQAKKLELTRTRDLAWQTYDTLVAKAEEVTVASTLRGREVEFAAPAAVPAEPVAPKKLLNGALGGFLGLLIALGLVLLAEHPALKELSSQPPASASGASEASL